jgi:HD-like signal output (HDOD) protein
MKAARNFISDMAEHISMPEVYLDIRRMIKNPDARISDFVKIIEADSMLSVRVIRMANSDYLGFPRKSENLYQAINLIGVMQLHDLLLSSLSLRTFSSIPEQILNLGAFWHYGVQCGIAASTLARYTTIPAGNYLFTLGLLHEVGHVLMYLKSPELSFQALDASQTQEITITDLEREYLGFDYGQLGAALMQFWHLPEVYQQVAAYHLQPDLADDNYRLEVQIVHLAHAICQNSDPDQRREIIASIAENNPQLKQLPADIDNVIQDQINTHSETVLKILWPKGAQALPFDKRKTY